MNIKIKKQSLIYDISNLAFVIADSGNPASHALHRLRDICQEGNIDRVARILGLAYTIVLDAISSVLIKTPFGLNRDFSSSVKDYIFNFSKDPSVKDILTGEFILHLKENIREFMICMVLADWLAVTYPEFSELWRKKADATLERIRGIAGEVSSSSSKTFSRKISPF